MLGDTCELCRGPVGAGRPAEQDHRGDAGCDVEEKREAGEPRICPAGHARSGSRPLLGSAIPDGLNPLNRSQKLVAISKIAMGESNHHRLTTLAKSGKMMKTKVHAVHHAEEITPPVANTPGIQCDLNHK